MFGIKKLLIGFCVGIVICLWFGVNIGKDKPIYGNPFHKVTIKDKLLESGSEVLKKGSEVLERGIGK